MGFFITFSSILSIFFPTVPWNPVSVTNYLSLASEAFGSCCDSLCSLYHHLNLQGHQNRRICHLLYASPPPICFVHLVVLDLNPCVVDSVPTPKVAPNLTCLLRVSQSVAPPSPTNSLVSCSRRDCTDQLVKKARKMCTESSMKDAFSTYSDYLNNFLSFFPLFPNLSIIMWRFSLAISYFLFISMIVRATDCPVLRYVWSPKSLLCASLVLDCQMFDYNDNEEYEAKVQGIDISPYPTVRGEPATFSISANKDNVISRGKLVML
ncbi:hypothetical protein Bca52824_081226 [Brassica carinata]|uniref:Uncharacterized protein n=1 Tax=Brassica carinata TaxID=52824 RepID=A0A8X7PGU5_BRACI|nr:hypothetical protein Bca52824_081226 [Brassica carinata]